MTAAATPLNNLGLPVWRERQRRAGRHRSIIVTRVVGSKVTGFDQDGRPVRMLRTTLARGWTQIRAIDLAGEVQFSPGVPAELHEIAIERVDDEPFYVSLLLVPGSLSPYEEGLSFALVKAPLTHSWCEYRPDSELPKDQFLERIEKAMRRHSLARGPAPRA